MAESSVVSSGDTIMADDHNTLREDILDTSLGHTHNGTDSKTLAINSTNFEYASSVLRLKDSGILTSKILNNNVTQTKLGYETGSYSLASADTERSKTGIGYSKVKEIKMARGGSIRVDFDLKQSGSGTAYGRIYVNGIAVGTERTTSSANYVNYSETISGLNYEDLVQLYTAGGAAYTTGLVQNFRLYTNLITEEVVTD